VSPVFGAHVQEKSIADGIKRVIRRAQGAKSLVVLTQEGVYAARDLLGRKPLVLGKSEDSWFVASESCAFDGYSGAKIVRDLAPGEIVFLTGDKEPRSEILEGSERRRKYCCFEWVYFCPKF